jgi:hypothetical protein
MLFGHLASRLSTHPENLATEALALSINRSPAMREALRCLVGRTGIELPRLVRFRSQAGDDQGNIPDLIGLDATGTERLLAGADATLGHPSRPSHPGQFVSGRRGPSPAGEGRESAERALDVAAGSIARLQIGVEGGGGREPPLGSGCRRWTSCARSVSPFQSSRITASFRAIHRLTARRSAALS